MIFWLKRIAQLMAVSAFLSVSAGAALAIDISPDLFVEGSCEDVIVWAAQPVDTLKDDLADRLGDGMAGMMKSASSDRTEDVEVDACGE
jgi:hypothetical protein